VTKAASTILHNRSLRFWSASAATALHWWQLLQKLALWPSLMTWIIIIIITRTSCDKSTPAAHPHTCLVTLTVTCTCVCVSCLLGCHSHSLSRPHGTWSVFKDKNAVYPLFSATNWGMCVCISTLFGLLSALERIFVFVHILVRLCIFV